MFLQFILYFSLLLLLQTNMFHETRLFLTPWQCALENDSDPVFLLLMCVWVCEYLGILGWSCPCDPETEIPVSLCYMPFRMKLFSVHRPPPALFRPAHFLYFSFKHLYLALRPMCLFVSWHALSGKAEHSQSSPIWRCYNGPTIVTQLHHCRQK